MGKRQDAKSQVFAGVASYVARCRARKLCCDQVSLDGLPSDSFPLTINTLSYIDPAGPPSDAVRIPTKPITIPI
jgi:hypothetical protein